MKLNDIRKLKTEDIQKKLLQLKQELSMLQGQAATGTPPKSPGKIKQIKKTMARMRTIEYERQIEELLAKASDSKDKKESKK